MNSASSPSVAPGVAARLARVFFAPGRLFTSLADRPVRHALWVVPVMTYVIVSWLGAALLFSTDWAQPELIAVQRAALQRQFQPHLDRGTMSQADVDQVVGQMERFAVLGQVAQGVLAPVFIAGISPFWGGLVLWAGAAWVMRRPLPYLKAVEAAGLSLLILALGAAVKAGMCLALRTHFTGPGAVLLLPEFDPTNQLHNTLLMVDGFVLWMVAVRAIALARLTGGPGWRAGLWVGGIWTLLTGGMLLLAWAAQWFSAWIQQVTQR
jgi:hypothetical protein